MDLTVSLGDQLRRYEQTGYWKIHSLNIVRRSTNRDTQNILLQSNQHHRLCYWSHSLHWIVYYHQWMLSIKFSWVFSSAVLFICLYETNFLVIFSFFVLFAYDLSYKCLTQLKLEFFQNVIQINVGCSQSFSYHNPVLLQYSHDSGLTWHLVSEPCYLPDKCGQSRDRPYSEGSIYYAGPYGEWRTVVIPITSHIAAK